MAGKAAAGERYAELGARGCRSGHSRDDFKIDSGLAQSVDFFLRAAEKHGVASLQPYHDTVLAGGVHQPLVYETLGCRMAAAALADENFPGARGERERLRVHERIVKDQLGALENFRRAQREKVRCAGSGAHKIDFTHRSSRRPQSGWRLRRSG